MTPSTSVFAFEEFVEDRGGALPTLTVRAGIAEMLAFYESVFPSGCANDSGDMLLFQWGTYNWGDGTQFEINIIRQFVESAAEGDDAISQLQLSFKFPPNKDTAVLGDGNRWCKSQSEAQQFREFIYSSRVFLANAESGMSRSEARMKRLMNLSISQDDPDVGYLTLPDRPGEGVVRASVKQTRLRDLVDYIGPDLFLDFYKDERLIGIEILS